MVKVIAAQGQVVDQLSGPRYKTFGFFLIPWLLQTLSGHVITKNHLEINGLIRLLSLN
jgi:hypothetical protein